jgi:hypothetical protein
MFKREQPGCCEQNKFLKTKKDAAGPVACEEREDERRVRLQDVFVMDRVWGLRERENTG